jgi:hypothetical protein
MFFTSHHKNATKTLTELNLCQPHPTLTQIKDHEIRVCHSHAKVTLKGQYHEIFDSCFFSWISFPQAPEYTFRAVSNLFENSRRYSQLKVHHRYHWHRWQMEKSSIIEVLIILFGHLWEVELTYRYNFAFKFTLRSQQPDIVPIICHRCHWRRYHWHRWQIFHRYQQH